jgi:hypothetical protein
MATFTYADMINSATMLELFTLIENGPSLTNKIDEFFFVYIDGHYDVAPMHYPMQSLCKVLENKTTIDEIVELYGLEMVDLIRFMCGDCLF